MHLNAQDKKLTPPYLSVGFVITSCYDAGADDRTCKERSDGIGIATKSIPSPALFARNIPLQIFTQINIVNTCEIL